MHVYESGREVQAASIDDGPAGGRRALPALRHDPFDPAGPHEDRSPRQGLRSLHVDDSDVVDPARAGGSAGGDLLAHPAPGGERRSGALLRSLEEGLRPRQAGKEQQAESEHQTDA